MPTKEELSGELNGLLSTEINFERLNKDGLKQLLDSIPYEFEEREVHDLGDFEEIAEQATVVRYPVPLQKSTFTLYAVKDGIVYTYSEDIEDQRPEENFEKCEFHILGQDIELWYYPEEITVEEAREQNMKKISKAIEEKFSDIKPGKIEIEGGGRYD